MTRVVVVLTIVSVPLNEWALGLLMLILRPVSSVDKIVCLSSLHPVIAFFNILGAIPCQSL